MSKARPEPSTSGPSRPAARARARAAENVAEGVRIFRADVDIALRRADRERRDRHALDQQERIALHQHPVGEGAAVAFVGVADDVFLVGCGAGDRAPFDPGGETRAAAPAQARGENLLDRLRRPHRQRPFEPGEAAMPAIVVERQRIDDAARAKRSTLLAFEKSDVLDEPERLRVRAAGEKARRRTATATSPGAIGP